jgi:hypothetical protein
MNRRFPIPWKSGRVAGMSADVWDGSTPQIPPPPAAAVTCQESPQPTRSREVDGG